MRLVSVSPMLDNDPERLIDRRIIVLIGFIFCLCVVPVITHSSESSVYIRDAASDQFYCKNILESGVHIDKDCQSFWYRTLSYPSIAWNFYYSCLTFILVLAAGITVLVGVVSARNQRADNLKLFLADQRPRLKVSFAARQTSLKFDSDGSLGVEIKVSVKNVGKSPALGVYVAYCLKYGSKDVFAKFSELRVVARQWLDVGSALYQGEKQTRTFKLKITKEELDRTWSGDLFDKTFYVCTSVPYRDGFEKSKIYESSPCGQLVLLGLMAPFPRNVSEFDLFKDSIKAQIIPADAFTILT